MMSTLRHDPNVTFLLFVVAIIGIYVEIAHPGVIPLVVYIAGALVGAIGLSLVAVIVRAQRRPVTTGVEGMIGAMVVASTALLPAGWVSYQGENWTAVLEAPATAADPGTELRIVSVEGLCLHVRPFVDILSNSSLTYGREA
jgi:membrane-bound ClpP family serine protease